MQHCCAPRAPRSGVPQRCLTRDATSLRSGLHLRQQAGPRPSVACQAHRQTGSLANVALAAAIAAASISLTLAPPAALAAATVAETTQPGTNVGGFSNAEVESKRKAAGFLRAYDGHVAIKNKKTKQLMDVKLDLQLPGTLLVRDTKGQVYYVSFASLRQIDLSDDVMVAALSEDNWENDLIAIEGDDDSGKPQKLQLTREGFYNIFSIAPEAEELYNEPPPAAKKR